MGDTGQSIKWAMLVCVPLALACPGAAKKCSEGCPSGTVCDTSTQLCVKATSTLAVSTESLIDGKVGVSYSAPLAAAGGEQPYSFALASKDAALAWLQIDNATGTLSGTPNEPIVAGKLTVSVTDQTAFVAKRDFTLTVAGCTDGESTACTKDMAGACLVGTQICAGGRVGADCNGALSTDVNRCGPGCGMCGAAADSCMSGACQCGAGAACSAGKVCCGGACVSLNDAANCGKCGNNCQALAGANVEASCGNGECAFACKAPYTVCPARAPNASEACGVNVSTDVANCGACGINCTPQLNASTATASCTGAKCTYVCAAGQRDCDSNGLLNGCETPVTVANCTGCGIACQTRPNSTPQCANPTSANPSCVPVCAAGFGNCNGAEADGCEVNLTNDVRNCGACNSNCRKLGDQCTNGGCQCGTSGLPCGQYTKCEFGKCVCDPQTAPDKCAP
jgi:Putative Ig domain